MSSPSAAGVDRSDSPVAVRRAAPHEWGDALAILVQDTPEGDRGEAVRQALEAVVEERLNLAGMLVAERTDSRRARCGIAGGEAAGDVGELIGAALSVAQPDGVAFVWLPVVSEREEDPASQIAAALWTGLAADLDTQPLVCAQVLLEPAMPVDRDALVRHGFRHTADLETMDRLLTDPLPPQGPALRLQIVPYEPPHNIDRFARAIERTYLDSHDCPAFTARRSGEEALESHALAGEFDPSRWSLFEVGGSDAGVLLLSVHSERNACELVYTGVVPEHRGKGLGRAMLREGLHAAAAWGCGAMFLAVDSANHYAIDIYRSLGFVPRGLREAWVRWPRGENPHREHSPSGA